MHRAVLSGAVLLCAMLGHTASAASIEARVNNVSGSTWEYTYTISNELSITIEEFSIFFALGVYSDLAVMSSPGGWDSIAIQPDGALPDDGFFDALSLAGGLAPGASASGFVLRFNYLAAGMPGAQLFHIVDPTTFDTMFAGTTTIVPLPPALLLFAGGLAILGGLRRRGALS